MLRKCPVPYPRGSWMGNHHFVFHPGTQVELGMDAEWRCEYCGIERDKYERELKRELSSSNPDGEA